MSNDYQKKEHVSGQVRISENVIRSIAGVTACEIEGVEGLAPVRQGLLRSTLPVTVSLTGDRVEITVRLILSSQVRLQSVAEQVQSEVKENVQNMTGIVVSKVHVIASDISFD